MKLLFIGSPAVGKGTYADLLKNELNIPHISASDLLKDEAKKGGELGNEINRIMKEGELVSDNIMIQLISKRINEEDCKNGFILDGFPRTEKQAEILDKTTEIDYVFNFKADDEVIIKRLSGRIVCKSCGGVFHKTGKKPQEEGKCDHCKDELIQREDDKPEYARKRLELYKEKTMPILEHYRKQGKVVEIIINEEYDLIKDKLLQTIRDFFNGKITDIGEIKSE